MTGTKYIVVTNHLMSDEQMILFPSTINHSGMAKCMLSLRYPKVVAAGFVDEFMQCYGESMTLRIKSRDIDTIMLHAMLSIDDKKIKLKENKKSLCEEYREKSLCEEYREKSLCEEYCTEVKNCDAKITFHQTFSEKE